VEPLQPEEQSGVPEYVQEEKQDAPQTISAISKNPPDQYAYFVIAGLYFNFVFS
jgi:hypothetical protein